MNDCLLICCMYRYVITCHVSTVVFSITKLTGIPKIKINNFITLPQFTNANDVRFQTIIRDYRRGCSLTLNSDLYIN